MRLLLVSFFFPPAGGGGVQRMLKFAKYLPEFGIDVHVLAPDDPRWGDRDDDLQVPAATRVHRSKYVGYTPGRPGDLLRRLPRWRRPLGRLGLQGRRLLIPDPTATWALTATRTGHRVVRREGIDVVLSTSPPAVDHLIGARVARHAGIPWVADFRDSWLEDPRLRLARRSVRLKTALNARLSDRLMQRVSHVTTAADVISSELTARYPHLRERTTTILNGVDLDDFENLEDRSDPAYFVIVHAGSFFGQRDIRPFLRAVRQIMQDDRDFAAAVRVRIVGTLRPHDAQWIEADDLLRNAVDVRGFVSYGESLAQQAAADLLLLLIPAGTIELGVPSGKLFEYIAARRPILAAVPPNGVAADAVRRLERGTVVAPDDHSAMIVAILHQYRAWRDGTASRLPMTSEIDAEISRRGRAQALADILCSLQSR